MKDKKISWSKQKQIKNALEVGAALPSRKFNILLILNLLSFYVPYNAKY